MKDLIQFILTIIVMAAIGSVALVTMMLHYDTFWLAVSIVLFILFVKEFKTWLTTK